MTKGGDNKNYKNKLEKVKVIRHLKNASED